MALLKSVICKSLFSYTPKPDSDRSQEAKTMTYNVKNDSMVAEGVTMSKHVAQKISQEAKLSDYFPFGTILVPVPRSSLSSECGLWPAKRITEALSEVGIGMSVDCLRRIQAVPQSSRSKSKNRPKPLEHYNTMEVQGTLTRPSRIVLVDDVVTSGATILAAASRIKEAFPDVQPEAFAVVKTVSDQNAFVEWYVPQTDMIKLYGERTRRSKIE